MLLGLSYNATTGRLSVEIIKGSHFRNFAVNRPPGNTFTHLQNIGFKSTLVAIIKAPEMTLEQITLL